MQKKRVFPFKGKRASRIFSETKNINNNNKEE